MKWKRKSGSPFRNALDKSERREFDEMWDIPRLYASACSNSCQLVPLHPIIISILFHHYKELKECINQIEQIGEDRVNSSKKQRLLNEVKKEEIPNTTTTLDSFYKSLKGGRRDTISRR